MTLKNLIHMFHHAPAPAGEAGRHITSSERRKNKKLCKDDDSREYRHFFERMRGRNKLVVRGLNTVPLTNVSFGEVVSDGSDTSVIKCAVVRCATRQQTSMLPTRRVSRHLPHPVRFVRPVGPPAPPLAPAPPRATAHP